MSNLFSVGKRIFLFVLVNILVVVTISIVMNFLGIGGYVTAYGIDYQSLMIFCLIWGFAGALISLALSRVMAKFMMGVQVIEPNSANPELRDLVVTVHGLARRAGIDVMPEVGVYQSQEVNAFATGPTKNRALVAVSTGLLSSMSRDQVEGVLGHEVAHIANGDMVTMTLVQGVVNAFVMFFARIAAFALSQNVKEENRRMVQYFATFVFEILLSFLGMFVVAYFSRLREYRADAGGARFAGREKMISALKGLKTVYESPRAVFDDSTQAVQSLKISSKASGFFALISTHPPLDLRIRRLELGGR